MLAGLLAAVFYGTCAVAGNFVNKAAMNILPLPNCIILAQTLTTLVVIKVTAMAGVIRLSPITRARLVSMLPICLCYSAHALLVLYSLQYLAVPMYNTLKRLTPVMVLGAKAATERRLPDRQITLSVLLIVAGCIVAGAGDLDFSGSGYLLALLCAAMQAAYIILAERGTTAINATSGGGGSSASGHHRRRAAASERPSASDPTHDHDHEQQLLLAEDRSDREKEKDSRERDRVATVTAAALLAAGSGRALPDEKAAAAEAAAAAAGQQQHLSPMEVLFFMALLGAPVFLASTALSGEAPRAAPALAAVRGDMGPVNFAAWAAATAAMEGLLTGSLVLCTQVNSALTTSVVGVLKGVVAVALGFVLLGGVTFSWVNVAGIAMNTMGGVWYSVVKYRSSRSRGGAGG